MKCDANFLVTFHLSLIMTFTMSNIGIIAIGRNEGERLRRCLASVTGRGLPVVYVDSNSSDGSAALAVSMGAVVVNLDMSVPFSAARARDAGFEKLMQLAPNLPYVQFVDGDCEIVEGWIEAAAKVLDERSEVAVVCGRRRERFPQKSIYNRMADIEWNVPTGEVKSCGGDAMMRASAFKEVGGFDPTVVAGEEPELCQRLRERHWKILRINAEMTLHDSAMLRFGQWWRRTIRNGYGAVDVASRFGQHGLYVRHVRSARLWGIVLPGIIGLGTVIIAIGLIEKLHGNSRLASLLAIAILLLIYPVQILRIAWGIYPRACSVGDALSYGVLTMVGKFAALVGQAQYRNDRSAGKLARAIEYKEVGQKRPVVTSQV